MDKCKDCIHCKQCAKNAHLPEFNPENIAYCKKFQYRFINWITKKLYLFLQEHFRLLIWYLYLSPVVGVISCNDLILRIILLFDVFLSLVMTTGNMKQWNKEVQ